MSVSLEFRDHVLELLAPLGPVSGRRFFGGIGLAFDGVQFAMMMGQTLYLRVDDSNRADFEGAGSEPFSYQTKKGRVFVRTYFQVPEEMLDEPDDLIDWTRKSIDVALRADSKKSKRSANVRKTLE